MKRLILMRHAKSDWTFDLDDHERPLNPRGHGAAVALGHWLREKRYLPDLVLCSTATRTRETLQLTGVKARTRFVPALYHAAPETMLDVLKTASAEVVMMVAHNPGIAWFARGLMAKPPDHPRFADYPTGATTIADFAITDWANVTRNSGTLIDFIAPRELTES